MSKLGEKLREFKEGGITFNSAARAWLLPDGRDAVAVFGGCGSGASKDCHGRPATVEIEPEPGWKFNVCAKCADKILVDYSNANARRRNPYRWQTTR